MPSEAGAPLIQRAAAGETVSAASLPAAIAGGDGPIPRRYLLIGSPHTKRRSHVSRGVCAMGIWLAFAPFIAFAVVDRLIGSTEGLLAGAAVSLALLVRDRTSGGREIKILDAGTAVLFCGLGCFAVMAKPDWSIVA